jgi:hypothetical protein
MGQSRAESLLGRWLIFPLFIFTYVSLCLSLSLSLSFFPSLVSFMLFQCSNHQQLKSDVAGDGELGDFVAGVGVSHLQA